jgi:hypothetical protein
MRTARMLSTALPLVFEASESARICGTEKLVTEIENLAEDLIRLHRQVLELPPQRSTPPEHAEDWKPAA